MVLGHHRLVHLVEFLGVRAVQLEQPNVGDGEPGGQDGVNDLAGSAGTRSFSKKRR